jgi:NAD-dependent deacetylase
VASGIPTFRGSDPGAVWSRDVTALATLRYFLSDPAGSWRWYRQRFVGILAARPNAAHRALVEIERWQAGRGANYLLVSQNIDTLHEQAGAGRLVKVHGSADRCRCSDGGCRLGAVDSIALEELDFDAFDRDPSLAHVPLCPSCGSLVRPHVLWFDELYTSHADYQWHVVEAAALRMDVLLCVGTSLAVGVTSFLQSAAARCGAPAFLIDPGERPPDAHPRMLHLRGEAERLLPALCRRLEIDARRAADR